MSLWAGTATALLAERDEDHGREVTRLQEVIAEREQELANRPERVVYENLDRQTVWEAEEERERAFRSRDHAFRTLTEIRLLHRAVDSGQCRCGVRACPIFELLNGYRALESWEAKQIQRVKQGRDHLLPAGHPAMLDRRGWGA